MTTSSVEHGSCDWKPTVGTTIRASRGSLKIPTATGRAVVATVQDDGMACILWEADGFHACYIETPDPPKGRYLQRQFLVAPPVLSSKSSSTSKTNHLDDSDHDDDDERIVPLQDLKSLLPFETSSCHDNNNDDISTPTSLLSVGEWKDRADQLLRLGDAASAASYYELALRTSSILQVGSSVIVKTGRDVMLADVDCIEDKEIEVIFLATNQEQIISEKQILLCISPSSSQASNLQERILLNLARCFLHLADLKSMLKQQQQQQQQQQRSQCFKSAVLASTLALTVASHWQQQQQQQQQHDDTEGNTKTMTSTQTTAYLLRAQSQAGLSKLQHAKADLKTLLKAVPNHKEGLKLLRQLDHQQKKQILTDKKLVKEISKLVNSAMINTTTAPNTNNTNNNTVSDSNKKSVNHPSHVESGSIQQPHNRTVVPTTTVSHSLTAASSSTTTTTTTTTTSLSPFYSWIIILPILIAILVTHFLWES